MVHIVFSCTQHLCGQHIALLHSFFPSFHQTLIKQKQNTDSSIYFVGGRGTEVTTTAAVQGQGGGQGPGVTGGVTRGVTAKRREGRFIDVQGIATVIFTFEEFRHSLEDH